MPAADKPAAEAGLVQVRWDRWPPSTRCEGINQAGERCRRYASRNSRWCHRHGSRLENLAELAEETVREARLSLKLSATEVADNLIDLATNPAVADYTRVRAQAVILDRIGIAAAPAVLVDASVHVNDSSAAAIIRERLQRLSTAIPGEVAADESAPVIEP